MIYASFLLRWPHNDSANEHLLQKSEFSEHIWIFAIQILNDNPSSLTYEMYDFSNDKRIARSK